MYSPMADIELLLAGSRELLEAENIDADRLGAWGAERSAIFCRLKEQVSVLASADQSTRESLLRELLDLDAQIVGRIMEWQSRLGKQIAAVRTMLHALPHDSSRAPQLLQRLA